MSHPIGDAAGYFAKKKEESTKSANALGLVVPQQQSPVSASDDQLSPASPEERTARQQNSNNDHFDPRAQWQRMINKLSFNGTDDSGAHRPRFQPSSSSFQHKPKLDHDSMSDNDSNSDNEHRPIELSSMMEPRFGKQKRQQQEENDATLPTPQELKNAAAANSNNSSSSTPSADTTDDDDTALPSTKRSHANYFTRPFSSNTSLPSSPHPLTSTPPPLATTDPDQHHAASPSTPLPNQHDGGTTVTDSEPLDNEQQQQQQQQRNKIRNESEDGKARLHWGKTLDKIRLIANLQKLHVAQPSADMDASTSLVPYCSALFDPPFVALSKDTQGRRPVIEKRYQGK